MINNKQWNYSSSYHRSKRNHSKQKSRDEYPCTILFLSYIKPVCSSFFYSFRNWFVSNKAKPKHFIFPLCSYYMHINTVQSLIKQIPFDSYHSRQFLKMQIFLFHLVSLSFVLDHLMQFYVNIKFIFENKNIKIKLQSYSLVCATCTLNILIIIASTIDDYIIDCGLHITI